MKKVLFVAFLLVLNSRPAFAAAAVADPLGDYLLGALARNGELEHFFSDDVGYRLELDLNNDGVAEILVSLGRDTSGREGNNWRVFRRSGGNYLPVGDLVFNHRAFYLGDIREMGSYGLVNFFPAGGGTGAFFGYVYDGTEIHKAEIGRIERDRNTAELRGTGLMTRYQGALGRNVESQIVPMLAREFGARYGISVDSLTYQEWLSNRVAARNITNPIPSAPGIAGAQPPQESLPPNAIAVVSKAGRNPDGPGDANADLGLRWSWGLAGLALVVVMLFAFRRKK